MRLTDAVELSGFLAEPDDVVAGWWTVDDLLPKGRDAAEVAVALARRPRRAGRVAGLVGRGARGRRADRRRGAGLEGG